MDKFTLDYIKTSRKFSREEEIRLYGKPLPYKLKNKYKRNKKVYVKMSEYESEKINFFDKTSNVLNVKGNMLSYKYDEELFTKYFNYEEVNIVDYINDRIYFIYKDNLYNYYEGKINYLGHYFEFNFNKNSNVFVYNK